MKTSWLCACLSLAVLALSPAAPAGAAAACDELAIRNAGEAGPVGYDYSFDRLDCLAPGAGASLLLGEEVLVAWFHDEAGLTGLSVELTGPGVAVTLPLREHVLGDGSIMYDTPRVTLPAGFEGELKATLLRDGAPLASATARTPL